MQNSGKKYASGYWICRTQKKYGKCKCDGTRIMDKIIEEKFVECYNEFIEKGYSLAREINLESQLDELLKIEQELISLRINHMIDIHSYEEEIAEIRKSIKVIKSGIQQLKVRNITQSDYELILEFNEDKVDKFIEKVIIHNWIVTFKFLNGITISRPYNNGKGGNKIGWNKGGGNE